MFKQVIKYTLLAVIWRRYRSMIVATLGLFFYFWLVGKLHQDFLAAYAQVNAADAPLAVSFLVKWLLLGTGLVVWLVYLWFWRRPRAQAEIATLEAAKRRNPRELKRETSPAPASPEVERRFEQLRGKQTLRSKSDLVIEKYPKKP